MSIKRNEGGSFESVGHEGERQTILPEARGKAEAYSTWAAQSGNLHKKTGKYTSGPLKGKTFDQGMQQFEGMWRSAPDSIKEKYASRSANRPYTDLAPSERKIQGISPTPEPSGPKLSPEQSRMKMYEDQKRSRIRMYQGDAGLKAYDESQKRTTATPAYDRDKNGVPDMIQRPSEPYQPQTTTAPSRAPVTASRPAVIPPAASINFAPGSDEARAAALTENSRNERFATADNGSGGMEAAIAMDKYQGRPVSAPVERTPVEGALDSAISANTRFWDRTTNAVESFVTAPFTPASEHLVGQESAKLALENSKKAQEARAAEQQRISAENAARLRREQGLPPLTAGMSTDDRMRAEGKTNGGPTPVVKAPRGQYQGSPMPAAPVPTNSIVTPSRIGPTPAGQELVGMNRGVPQYASIGQVYGQSTRAADATPGGGGVGPVRPAATDESIRADYQVRQSTPQAQAGAQRMMEADRVTPTISGIRPTPPPRGPASQPERVGSSLNDPNNAFSDAAYARTAAAKTQGVRAEEARSRAVNPPGMQLVGPKRPLDELVSRAKLRGIGTPSIMPGVSQTPPRFQPGNTRGLNENLNAPQVMPARPPAPRKPLIPGSTRPVFAMSRR